MQPSQPQSTKPVMDVTAPIKNGVPPIATTGDTIVVPPHVAPADATHSGLLGTPATSSSSVPVQKAPASSEDPRAIPAEASTQVQAANEKTLHPGPQQAAAPATPVGAIIGTIFVMLLLSTLATMVYFQSNT